MERLQDSEVADDNGKVRGNSWETGDDDPFQGVWRPTQERAGSKLGHDEVDPRKNGGKNRHDERNMAEKVTDNEDDESFGGRVRYEHNMAGKVTKNENQSSFGGKGRYEHNMAENDDATKFGAKTKNGGKLRYQMAQTSTNNNNSKTSLARTLRKMGVSRYVGVSGRGWKVWMVAGAIYCCLILFLQQSSPFALTPQEEAESLKEWTKENEVALRQRYRERGAVAHDVCAAYDVYTTHPEYIKRTDQHQGKLEYSEWFQLKRINWDYMYYAHKEDFVYCKVPKSGSSTWVYNLLKMADAPQDQISSDIGLHKLLRFYYPKVESRKMKKVFKRSLKLLVVRHPFERVLSAYRDKLENYQRDLLFRDGYYYTLYGKNIVKVYRDDSDRTLANRTEPTWREFVRYVITTPASKFDEHWRPVYSLCSPCVLKYDVIAKMETFSEDTQFVINQLALEDKLQVEWIHRTAAGTTSDVASHYFSQLTRLQVDQLYETYQLDFELFGYDYDAYWEMAIP